MGGNPTRRKNMPKKAAERTLYVVQRRISLAGGQPEVPDGWQDVGVYDAATPLKAIESCVERIQAQPSNEPVEGDYRAVARRYLSDVIPVTVETKVEVTLHSAKPAPSKADTA
jgi:hypothetical protein